MNRYGYTLKKAEEKETPQRYYHKADLQAMTTYQLKEICREEKLIQGVVNPLDKEELLHVILKYRGMAESLLIKSYNEGGMQALEKALKKCRLDEKPYTDWGWGSKVVVWEGIAARFYDQMTIPYEKRLAGTNALVVSGDGTVCTILNAEARGKREDVLYLTKEAGILCRQPDIKNFCLYCMGRRESEAIYGVYYGLRQTLPEHMEVYRIPLLDFEVRQPAALPLPLAIDFGTSSTTAGVYLDGLYFQAAGIRDGELGLKKDKINHAVFYDASADWEESPLLPSMACVTAIEQGDIKFSFGYDAVKMANESSTGEGFSIFYDMKRWVADYEKEEEVTDRQGRRGFIKRKDILKAYFLFVLEEAANRFKCKIGEVHASCPVKQKARFGKMFSEILPGYDVELQDMVDEGAAVLYGTIRDMINRNSVIYGEEYRALVIDCGGGTTDMCSCRFRIWDERVSYRISIETSYENGDADFGGNNLTYRIMQLLKVLTVKSLRGKKGDDAGKILGDLDNDIYRAVDECGTEGIYLNLTEQYRMAEDFLPTHFKEYEYLGREDYEKARNNFYFLFRVAEKVKKVFFDNTETIRVVLSSRPVEESATVWIPVDKWKIAVRQNGHLEVLKEFSPVYFTAKELEILLKADIYAIVRRFLEEMYENGQTEKYSLIKLTGQSCKIGLFRDALKEFVPGKAIRFVGKERNRGAVGTEPVGLSEPLRNRPSEFGLKMACVDGILEYLRDKKYGLADIDICMKESALPYTVTAFTHSGEDVTLVDGFKREKVCGMISRNMEELLLRIYLKDAEGNVRHEYVCQTPLDSFNETTYEELEARHGGKIRQADTDDITEREVKFFVWAETPEWEFCVLPVCRRKGRLAVGKEERFPFENDAWVRNYFDGTW